MEVQLKKLTKKKETEFCYLPKDIFESLELSEAKQYKLNLGQRFEYSFIKPGKTDDKIAYLSNSAFNKLLLHEDIILNIWRKNDEIYFGPVVGMFVNRALTNALKKGRRPLVLQKFAEGGSKTKCLSYYFSFDDIDWKEEKIKGYSFIHNLSKWVHDWFPIPDVIYDRGTSFKKEQRPYASDMRKQFRKSTLHFINNKTCLGKWELHKCLSKHSKMSSYLPKAIAYRNFNDVLKMLNKYKFIFIKSFGGSQGKQVLSIEKVDKKYKLNFYDHKLKEITLENVEELKMFVESFGARRGYMIQQGVRLLKCDGRNMDVRVLMTKGGQGEWEHVSDYARIAKQNYTITNCALGGEFKKYMEVYPGLSSPLSKKGIPDINDLVNTAKKILYYIEKELGSFGDVGFDLAIDIYGDIWLIEANARPDKQLPLLLSGETELPLVTANIFEYAKFLVKYDTHSKK